MKFLITWEIHEGKLHDTLALFAEMSAEQESAMMGEVKLVTRWHDLVRGTGAAVFEAENAAAISAYSMSWNRFMDLDISVVVDDDEARTIGRNLAG